MATVEQCFISHLVTIGSLHLILGHYLDLYVSVGHMSSCIIRSYNYKAVNVNRHVNTSFS